jgi:hypothetical protein
MGARTRLILPICRALPAAAEQLVPENAIRRRQLKSSDPNGGHLSGGELTGRASRAAAGSDRPAGRAADAGAGNAGGDRAGRPAGCGRPAGRGDRADQAAASGAYRRQAAGRIAAAQLRGRTSGSGWPASAPTLLDSTWSRCPTWRRRPRLGWPASRPPRNGTPWRPDPGQRRRGGAGRAACAGAPTSRRRRRGSGCTNGVQTDG